MGRWRAVVRYHTGNQLRPNDILQYVVPYLKQNKWNFESLGANIEFQAANLTISTEKDDPSDLAQLLKEAPAKLNAPTQKDIRRYLQDYPEIVSLKQKSEKAKKEKPA